MAARAGTLGSGLSPIEVAISGLGVEMSHIEGVKPSM
jgi:hypothetical protein